MNLSVVCVVHGFQVGGYKYTQILSTIALKSFWPLTLDKLLWLSPRPTALKMSGECTLEEHQRSLLHDGSLLCLTRGSSIGLVVSHILSTAVSAFKHLTLYLLGRSRSGFCVFGRHFMAIRNFYGMLALSPDC